MTRTSHGPTHDAIRKLKILATFYLTPRGRVIYGVGMITQDKWRDDVAMLTDSELSALAAVLVDEQRKRDEAAQLLADEQAAREWAEKGGKW